MKEDPTRDPASEARDDHASEPRATPETDALVPSQGRIRTIREYIDELEAHARRLERQRDELRDKTIDALAKVGVLTEAADYLNGRLREVTAQRDELLEIANRAVSALDGNLRCEETCKCSGRHQISELQAAIAAVKGGQP
jgi:uncharacterized coiled-coil DUF342 family protein